MQTSELQLKLANHLFLVYIWLNRRANLADAHFINQTQSSEMQPSFIWIKCICNFKKLFFGDRMKSVECLTFYSKCLRIKWDEQNGKCDEISRCIVCRIYVSASFEFSLKYQKRKRQNMHLKRRHHKLKSCELKMVNSII